MRFYAYLRASTKEQNASRAESELREFSEQHHFKISAFFRENESGARLHRPELFRLLEVAEPGDVLLTEAVDRISRLNREDWENLKRTIQEKGIRIVALDLPTSHQLVNQGDEFSHRMHSALNGMMLDMLAAVARKDYEDRRKRQAQGIVRAKEQGKYRGRQDNLQLQKNIASLLDAKKSWTEIQEVLGCSRGTIAKVSKKKRD